MANLVDLYSMLTDEMRNRIVAACWNKAKAILTAEPEVPKNIVYARDVLLVKAPVEKIVIGALVILQDTDPLTDAAIQTAVDAVVAKLLSVEE